jgi:hypothetical protein
MACDILPASLAAKATTNFGQIISDVLLRFHPGNPAFDFLLPITEPG